MKRGGRERKLLPCRDSRFLSLSLFFFQHLPITPIIAIFFFFSTSSRPANGVRLAFSVNFFDACLRDRSTGQILSYFSHCRSLNEREDFSLVLNILCRAIIFFFSSSFCIYIWKQRVFKVTFLQKFTNWRNFESFQVWEGRT